MSDCDLSKISMLTLEEKASLCSGLDGWRTKPVETKGIGSIFMADGSNGLRKEGTDADGKTRAEAATCYPCSCLTACSFDTSLMEELGEALALEARAKAVDLLLAPGINIKRSPLCGRNFEYLSEDPYLAGKLSAALIRGLQKSGVGATLKHFALNNQEKARLSSNSIVDVRALREIYLAAFETVVKEAEPWAVMSSYNKVDGIYDSEHPVLLRDILRDEWGYDGLVMSDWGAVNNRANALRAGLDLEMPGNGGLHDRMLVDAVKSGELEETYLDAAARHVVALVEKAQAAKPADGASAIDIEAQHKLARKFAAKSIVLLKNEGDILPLDAGTADIAVVGEFARTARYQGGGAANVRSTRVPSFLEEAANYGAHAVFAPGYLPEQEEPDSELMAQAVETAKGKNSAIVFAGLPNSCESEGYDRPHMSLPAAQNKLIEAIAAVNPNTVVVLFAGGPVEMPWIHMVSAVLMAYLPGQAGGGAIADILFGKVSPSGRLPESFPLRLQDSPSYNFFGQEDQIEYRESIFVGYRYFGLMRPVLFPFGHGLSYSRFEYSNLNIDWAQDGGARLSLNLTNAGERAAVEVVQVYVTPPEGPVMQPELELRAFDKIYLQPHETRRVEFSLGDRAFSFYNAETSAWQVLGGCYRIHVGASSRDIRLSTDVERENSNPTAPLPDYRSDAPEYYNLERLPSVSAGSFAKVLGYTVQKHEAQPFTRNSTLKEISSTMLGRRIHAFAYNVAAGGGEAPPQEGQDITVMLKAQVDFLPLSALVVHTRGAISYEMLDGIVLFLNRRRMKGIFQLIGAWLKKNRDHK